LYKFLVDHKVALSNQTSKMYKLQSSPVRAISRVFPGRDSSNKEDSPLQD